MGALVVHERWAHGVTKVPIKKKLLRKSYRLRFKAEVLATFDNLRALKCKECTAIVVPGRHVASCSTWDIGCECGCKEYTRDMRYKGVGGVEVVEWVEVGTHTHAHTHTHTHTHTHAHTHTHRHTHTHTHTHM